jgi:hypothetical protein
MLRPPFILLILCIIGKILWSKFPTVITEGTQTNLPYKGNLKVVLVCTSNDSWYDIALHVLSQASAPLNIKVEMLMECGSVKDIHLEEEVEQMKGLVRLTHVKRKGDGCPIRRLKRLTNRCVRGDETIIVYMDTRARLVRSWDLLLMKLHEDNEGDLIISAPCGSRTGMAKFPTLTGGSENGVLRGLDRKFGAHDLGISIVPSVCICTEFCSFRPKMLKSMTEWKSSPVALTRDMDEKGYKNACPTCVLLERDKSLYGYVVKYDKGCSKSTIEKPNKIGLVKPDDDKEKIVKFGSCRAANLTMQFL